MIKGYLVVLKPEHVGQGHGDRLSHITIAGKHVAYRGLDRDPWYHLDELFYRGGLGEELKRLRREIEAVGQSDFSAGVCADLPAARLIHAASAQCGAGDEILWIESAACASTHDRKLLGFDVHVDGYGSLIRLGMFASPEVFRDYESCLNQHGLFSDLETIRRYARAYCARWEQANLEPIEPDDVGDDAIFRIFEVPSDSIKKA